MDFFVFEIKRRKSAIRAQFHIIYQKHVKPFKFVNPKTRPLFKLYAPFERLCRKILQVYWYYVPCFISFERETDVDIWVNCLFMQIFHTVMTSWLSDTKSSLFVNKKDKVWINRDKMKNLYFLFAKRLLLITSWLLM